MVFELSILNIIILFGAIQGFLLALILLTTKRLQKKSNYFLALLLSTLALINFLNLMEMRPSGIRSDFSHYHPFYLVNLIPPAAYFFIKFLVEPNYKWRRIDYLFFLPIVIEVVTRLYKLSFYIKGDLSITPHITRLNFWINTIELFASIFAIVVIIVNIRSLRSYEQKLRANYSEVETRSLSWLRNILIGGIILTLLWLAVTISDYGTIPFNLILAQLALLGLSLLIYWVGYSMIIRQELLEAPIFAITNSSNQNTSETSELSSKADEYFQQLKDLMVKDKIYQDENLNMTTLSLKTGLSNSYLSQIINQKEGKNFFDFVNAYRVKEVQEKIIDPKFEHYTILGLAQEAGFKSKSTFNNFFKKTTGKTPSAYRKEMKTE